MTPDDYLKRPYQYILIWDEDSKIWAGRIKEFPGCFAIGDAWNIIWKLRISAHYWIAAALDLGQAIPEPEAWRE